VISGVALPAGLTVVVLVFADALTCRPSPPSNHVGPLIFWMAYRYAWRLGDPQPELLKPVSYLLDRGGAPGSSLSRPHRQA
jgi:hypothetical protein